MGLNNSIQEDGEDTDENYQPIGVKLDANVIVDTNEHVEAQEVARRVAEELSGEIEDEDVEVHMSSTNDHFNPE